MPTDSRRLQGPEDAFSYKILEDISNQEKALEVGEKVPLVVDGLRRDKRKPCDARPLFLKTGIITQAKGSAYVEQGNTKVICGVHGPREVQKKSDFSLNGQLYCEFKFAPFSCIRRRGHQQDSEELELSSLLKEALEAAVCLHHFPKAQVEVYVMVMENDGSAFAAALTCASLALASASIPMYDIVIGASVRQLNGVSLLDPVQEEEWRPQAGQDKHYCNLSVGFMPSLHQVCGYLQEGVPDVDELNDMLKLATEYCLKVEPIAQLCLKEAVQKMLSEELNNKKIE